MVKINNINIDTKTVEIMATQKELNNIELDFAIIKLLKNEGYNTIEGILSSDESGNYNGYKNSDGDKLYHTNYKFVDISEVNK